MELNLKEFRTKISKLTSDFNENLKAQVAASEDRLSKLQAAITSIASEMMKDLFSKPYVKDDLLTKLLERTKGNQEALSVEAVSIAKEALGKVLEVYPVEELQKILLKSRVLTLDQTTKTASELRELLEQFFSSLMLVNPNTEQLNTSINPTGGTFRLF